MPRKYSMDARSAAVAETRQRIIDATVELHARQGISGTSMQDIAEHAGVALATVYRHFPTLDELVPACGGRIMQLNPLPASAVFEALEPLEARVKALVVALHATYARGERSFEVAQAEVLTLPVVARFVEETSAYVASLVALAAAPYGPGQRQLKLAAGLCDFRVWQALVQSGLSHEETTHFVTRLVCASLSGALNTEAGPL